MTGGYVVWGWVISNSREAASFFVTLDNKERVLWNTQRGGTETWVWDRVRQRGGDDPVIFFLEAGAHTLVIERREAGTKIDRLLITNTIDDIP